MSAMLADEEQKVNCQDNTDADNDGNGYESSAMRDVDHNAG